MFRTAACTTIDGKLSQQNCIYPWIKQDFHVAIIKKLMNFMYYLPIPLFGSIRGWVFPGDVNFKVWNIEIYRAKGYNFRYKSTCFVSLIKKQKNTNYGTKAKDMLKCWSNIINEVEFLKESYMLQRNSNFGNFLDAQERILKQNSWA